ncbi:MAG: EAL domain-containing protein [Burkholderiales bacterium]|nr:EAL domain-containing protein [Burkholderiales bacterium]MDE1927015.1 EAL domain-containing protein [Burkholderiales bacterium]MDE2158003.1 EAL domain-containing protein [Burkholderiales bacterium]MDE2502675.1 EAL domain-containing protein [Burkholderiales bacterium]
MNDDRLVLVVEDDLAARLLTRSALARAGFRVAEACNGLEAVESVRAELPDLVLMDVGMPVLDGYGACEAIRAIPAAARVPLVMMTGLDDVESIERAFVVGASDFITKPINWAILAHRVRYMLRASAAMHQLEQNQRRLSNAQRIGVMGDWEWDLRRDRIVPSEQAWRIVGQDPGRRWLDGAGFFAACHADDRGRLRGAVARAVANGDAFAIDHRIVRPDGAVRHLHQQVEVVERDAAGHALRLAGALHDVTRQAEAEAEIRRLAYYDPLTGLPNRLLFNEQLAKAIAHAQRHRLRCAIMFVDLDNFKRVNDTLGHGAGDELLRQTSVRLQAALRGHDSVARHEVDLGDANLARLGGDEFVVLLTDLARGDEAGGVARRLVDAMAVPATLQGQEFFVGGSVGVALYPDDGGDAATLLMNADTAMYRAKEAGRGCFQFYDRSMNGRALERLVLETELRRGLERSEFVLHYQPRVAVAGGAIVGAEALMRWQHPERGLVPPGEFIPTAEQSGLVVLLGEWALAEVCRQLAAWRDAGLPVRPVAVNLAASHLRERGLPERVAAALCEYGVEPSLLEIEVTESLLLTEPELSMETANRLAALGVRLSIDDFGTGYSSLSMLKRLPIHAVKIDRSFVRDLATDPDDAAITTAIVAMAHGLKLAVVAEGVETAEQLAFLQRCGCDEYQGWLKSRALPPDDYAALLAAAAPAA